MRFDKFTAKLQAAIAEAQALKPFNPKPTRFAICLANLSDV